MARQDNFISGIGNVNTNKRKGTIIRNPRNIGGNSNSPNFEPYCLPSSTNPGYFYPIGDDDGTLNCNPNAPKPYNPTMHGGGGTGMTGYSYGELNYSEFMDIYDRNYQMQAEARKMGWDGGDLTEGIYCFFCCEIASCCTGCTGCDCGQETKSGGGGNNSIIQTNLTALRNDFVYKSSGQPYEGPFHVHANGTLMIGAGRLGINHAIKPNEVIVPKGR